MPLSHSADNIKDACIFMAKMAKLKPTDIHVLFRLSNRKEYVVMNESTFRSEETERAYPFTIMIFRGNRATWRALATPNQADLFDDNPTDPAQPDEAA